MISSARGADGDEYSMAYGGVEGKQYTAYDLDVGFDLDDDGIHPIPVEPTPPYPDDDIDGDIDGCAEGEGGDAGAAAASPFIEVVQKKLHRNWLGTIRNPFTFCLGWSLPAGFTDAAARAAVNSQYYLTNYLIFFAIVFVLSCITNIWAILCLCSIAGAYIALEMNPITACGYTAPRALNAALFATCAVLSAHVFGLWQMLGTSAAVSLAAAAAHAVLHAIPDSCQDDAGNILWANANKPGESVITTIKASMMRTAVKSAVDSALGDVGGAKADADVVIV